MGSTMTRSAHGLDGGRDTADWRGRAECAKYDPDMFIVGSGTAETNQEAAKICRRDCPVRTECRDWAIATKATDAVYGGWIFRGQRIFPCRGEEHLLPRSGEQVPPTEPTEPKPLPGRQPALCREAVFAAAREYLGGADLESVRQRHGLAKSTVYVGARILRHRPDLVDIVLKGRMSLNSADAQAGRAARKTGATTRPMSKVDHGLSRYSYGCRCEVCREAATAYRRAWRAGATRAAS